jgi:hypothetical protein
MRRFHPLMFVLASILSLAAVPSSFAAVASVSIDWSQLQTQIVSISGLPAPSLTFSSQSTRLTDSANSAGDGSESQDHVLPNWTDTKNQNAHTTNADGTAIANGATISALTSATAPPSTFCCDSNGSASADRNASFALSGPGSLIFSVPYTVSGAGEPNDFFASTSASLNGSISFFSNEGGSSQGNKSISFNSFSGVPFAQSGTLVFGIVADAAGIGFVDFQISAFSQAFSSFIPEPSVYFQLAAGLGAIVVIGRRRIMHAAQAT